MKKGIYKKRKYAGIALISLFLLGCWANSGNKAKSSALPFAINGNWQVYQIVHGNGIVQKTPDEAQVLFTFKKNLTFEIVYKMNGDVVESYDGTYTLLPDSTLHTYKLKAGGHDESKIIQVSEDSLQLLDTKKSKDLMCLIKVK